MIMTIAKCKQHDAKYCRTEYWRNVFSFIAYAIYTQSAPFTEKSYQFYTINLWKIVSSTINKMLMHRVLFIFVHWMKKRNIYIQNKHMRNGNDWWVFYIVNEIITQNLEYRRKLFRRILIKLDKGICESRPCCVNPSIK